jgi:hypothetical protein
VLLAAQTGSQLMNIERNLDKKKEQFKCPEDMLQCFFVDVLSEDHGYSAIEDILSLYKYTQNIIMASLGPKLGALALFKMNISNREYALVYTPANEYNDTYSSGKNYSNVQYGSLNLNI